MVEPFALDNRAKNITENPMATLLYNASTCVCTPNSLSQEVGLGLGAQAGEERLRHVFLEAGFSSFERCTETPLNLIFQARSGTIDVGERNLLADLKHLILFNLLWTNHA